MPVAEIAALAKKHGALCVVDGAQAVGAIAIDVRALRCDAYATSGHKWLMGPKGTGFVFISERAADESSRPMVYRSQFRLEFGRAQPDDARHRVE